MTARHYDDLLTQVLSSAVDRDYVVAAQRNGGRGERPGATPAFVAIVAVFGILIGVSALKTEQDRPAQVAERAQLVDSIHSRQDRLDALHATLTSLLDDVTRQQAALAREVSSGSQLSDRLTSLGVSAGMVEVTGPGVTVTVDNAPDSAVAPGGVIRDSDLQLLVNGLWQAGAEGIAIDGHRLTSLTSIRYAGRAITVDYRSLTPPYLIDAIGNPRTLPARLLETDAGKVWQGLVANFGIGFSTSTSQQVTLPADRHDHLVYAHQWNGRR